MGTPRLEEGQKEWQRRRWSGRRGDKTWSQVLYVAPLLVFMRVFSALPGVRLAMALLRLSLPCRAPKVLYPGGRCSRPNPRAKSSNVSNRGTNDSEPELLAKVLRQALRRLRSSLRR